MGKKLLILYTILFGLPLALLSQTNENDSLKKILSSPVEDSVLFEANRLLAVNYWDNNPDSSLLFGNSALVIAKRMNDNTKTAMALQGIGVAFDYKDNLDSCLKYLNEGLSVYRSAGNIEGASHILSDIAIAYYFRGNYELALRNHFEALNLRQKSGNKRFVAISYNNIGLVYRARKQYANSAAYYQKSLAIKREIGDEQGILNSLLNIGSALHSQEKYDSAIVYATEAFDLAKKINATEDMYAAEGNMGAALVNLGKYDEAFVRLIKVLEAAEKNNYRNILYTTYESMGDIFSSKGNGAEAKEYYKKGLELSISTSRNEQVSVFYRKLAKNAYKEGDFKQAYEYAELSKQVSDTLYNETNSRQINEMAAVYETAQKEKKIEKLNGENAISSTIAKRRKKERNYFIIASVLFLGIASVAYKAFAANKKKKEQLLVQNNIIEKALTEKEFLMKEIHHRVKNNLQVVSSLLKLQAHYIKDEQAQEAVKDSRNRVQSMALIHQNLYQEDNLTGIDIKDYSSKLCENLFQSYNIHPARINLVKEIQSLNLDVDVVVPIGLVLNELITNSLKYGFPGDRPGTIKIELKEDTGGLLLKVYDNGIGLPEDFHEKYQETFGYKMIKAFVQKLKGELKIYTEDGTRVEIRITNYKSLSV